LLAAFLSAFGGRPRDAGVAGNGSSISHVPRQNLVNEHVRGLDADADYTCNQPHHCVGSFVVILLESLQTRVLDLLDLISDEPESRHVSAHFGDCIGWQWHSFRRPHFCDELGCLPQSWLEGSHSKSNKTRLHSIDDARPFANQVLALAISPFRVLFLHRWDRRHVAMMRLTA